jgi:hypothetical protein
MIFAELTHAEKPGTPDLIGEITDLLRGAYRPKYRELLMLPEGGLHGLSRQSVVRVSVFPIRTLF